MPCRDDYPREDPQPKIDNLTRMLCELCALITTPNLADRENISISQVAGLKGWWVEHQRRDAERVAREQAEERQRALVKSGLNKLTHEERKALKLQ